MISKDKQYRTRDGRQVRIYATDGAGEHPVHGAIKNRFDWWDAWQWTHGGRSDGYMERETDLIEMKPRHTRTVWLNFDADGTFDAFVSKEKADFYEHDDRIACIRVDLDFAEGEGL